MNTIKTQPPGSTAASYSVERTTRDVIEHKLLTALEEGGVAALLSQQDLEDLVFACKLCPMRDGRATRLGNLQRGMEQLLREAFPPNAPHELPATVNWFCPACRLWFQTLQIPPESRIQSKVRIRADHVRKDCSAYPPNEKAHLPPGGGDGAERK